MKPSLFLTRRLPPLVMEKLEEAFEVECNPDDRVLRKEEIITGVRGKDALLCLLTDQIDGEVMDAGNLKVISNYAVGFNNIDVAAATERGIPVCNTPGVLTETTADLTWALLLGIGRRVAEGDRMTRAGKFDGWGPMMLLGGDIYGKRLGLVGMGRIAHAVARRAKGFGMEIVYTNRSPKPEIEAECGARQVELEELLRESDFVSVHVPLTAETTHLLGEKELRMMKPTAYLVNTARGPVIDEAALVRVLKDEAIAGAGLDVYEEEPKLAEGLMELDNALLLPHLGSATIETRTQMGMMAAENAMAIFAGKPPLSIANQEVLSGV